MTTLGLHVFVNAITLILFILLSRSQAGGDIPCSRNLVQCYTRLSQWVCVFSNAVTLPNTSSTVNQYNPLVGAMATLGMPCCIRYYVDLRLVCSMSPDTYLVDALGTKENAAVSHVTKPVVKCLYISYVIIVHSVL